MTSERYQLTEFDTQISRLRRLKGEISQLNTLRRVLNSQPDVNICKSVLKDSQRLLTVIEDEITNIKEEQQVKIKQTEADIANLSKQIDVHNKLIESWDSVTTTIEQPTVCSGSTDQQIILEEVKAYDDFLKKHGSSGGWDVFHHELFVRFQTRFKDRQECVRIVSEKTGLSIDVIENHFSWYQQLKRLQNARREAILRWKATKRTLLTRSSIKQDGDVLAAGGKTASMPSKEKREKQKEDIEAWKERKRQDQLLALQQEEFQRKQLQQEQEKRKTELAVKKALVLDYKKKSAFIDSPGVTDAPKVSGKELRRKSEQQIATLKQSKLERQQQRESEERARQQRLHRMKQKVSRKVNESLKQRKTSLLQPTESVAQRQKAAQEEQYFFSVKELPRRHVPQWRQD